MVISKPSLLPCFCCPRSILAGSTIDIECSKPAGSCGLIGSGHIGASDWPAMSIDLRFILNCPVKLCRLDHIVVFAQCMLHLLLCLVCPGFYSSKPIFWSDAQSASTYWPLAAGSGGQAIWWWPGLVFWPLAGWCWSGRPGRPGSGGVGLTRQIAGITPRSAPIHPSRTHCCTL